MKVSFEGVGEQVISFAKANGTEKNMLVKVSANNTVAACAAGDKFAGCCIAVNGGFADVKTAGYIEVGYTGTAPAVGYAKLVAADNGKVKTGTDGREYLVLKVDTAAATVGFIM